MILALIIAQAAATGAPDEFSWIKGALLALPTIASAIAAWAALTGRKTQIEGDVNIRSPKELVTKAEHDKVTKLLHQRITDGDKALDEDISTLGDKIEAAKKDLSLEGSRRSGQLNQRMDGLAEKVTTAATKVDLVGNQVNRIEGKIDAALRQS